MEINKTDVHARELTYLDFLTKYVWKASDKVWKEAKRFCDR
jgi:hypothetical protein